MPDSDSNLIDNTINNNDSSFSELKTYLENDKKVNPGDRCSNVIGIAISCVENFTKSSLKDNRLSLAKGLNLNLLHHLEFVPTCQSKYEAHFGALKTQHYFLFR